jgi:hypothetical protein
VIYEKFVEYLLSVDFMKYEQQMDIFFLMTGTTENFFCRRCGQK